MFSQLTFRTPCPLLLSLFSLSSRLAPPTRAPHSAIGCREAVFPTRMVAEHVNHTSSDLFTECMSERGRDSATGLQQLTAEHFTQCLKEQRGWKTAAQNTLCNFVVFFYTLEIIKAQRGHDMRHAVAPPENVENTSFAVTSLLKICTHCERLNKKVRYGGKKGASGTKTHRCQSFKCTL